MSNDDQRLRLRRAAVADLDALNRVIELAIGCWAVSDRVRRQILPLYRYDEMDLQSMQVQVGMLEPDDRIVAVAGMEWRTSHCVELLARGGHEADAVVLLLHGIYVLPELHGRGLGQALLRRLSDDAGRRGALGVLVKAQRGAEGFFQAMGFEHLPVRDPQRDYPHRYWLPLKTTRAPPRSEDEE